jgi:IS30 family transposase
LGGAVVQRYVARQIKYGWSPELIAGRLRLVRPAEAVSHEAIYQWVYTEARQLIPYLVRAHKRRLRRGYSRRHTKAHIPGRIPIEKRPEVANERRRIGDWEADTVVSRRSKAALQVLVERKTRYVKVKKLPRRGAHEMRVGMTRTLSRYPEQVRRTITYDNGTENTDHLITNAVLGTRSYFCAPFHSWERGSVENTIGLLRREFPKGTDFAKVPDATIKKAERRLNGRPRKVLGYKTPAETLKPGGAFAP